MRNGQNPCDVIFHLCLLGESISRLQDAEAFSFLGSFPEKCEKALVVFSAGMCEPSSEQIPVLGPRSIFLGWNSIPASGLVFVPAGFFLTQQLVACSPHANDDVWNAKELRRPLFPGPFAPGCCLLPSDFKGCHPRLPLLLSRLGMTTVPCIFTLLVTKELREPSSPHSELSRKKSHQDARGTHTWWAWLLSGLWLTLEKAHSGGCEALQHSLNSGTVFTGPGCLLGEAALEIEFAENSMSVRHSCDPDLFPKSQASIHASPKILVFQTAVNLQPRLNVLLWFCFICAFSFYRLYYIIMWDWHLSHYAA